MKATNYRDRKVVCCICGCEELKDYKTYLFQFSDSIDTTFVGWCSEHEKEGLEYYNRENNRNRESKYRSSNS